MYQITEIPKALVDTGLTGFIIASGLFIANQVVTLANRLKKGGTNTHAGAYRGPEGTTALGGQQEAIIARDCVHRIDKKTDDMIVCIQKLTFLQERVVAILEREK